MGQTGTILSIRILTAPAKCFQNDFLDRQYILSENYIYLDQSNVSIGEKTCYWTEEEWFLLGVCEDVSEQKTGRQKLLSALGK